MDFIHDHAVFNTVYYCLDKHYFYLKPTLYDFFVKIAKYQQKLGTYLSDSNNWPIKFTLSSKVTLSLKQVAAKKYVSLYILLPLSFEMFGMDG